MMFMKRWSSPFWRKVDLKLILQCLPMALQIPHSRRDRKWILIVSKFRFIIFWLLVSFFRSHISYLHFLCFVEIPNHFHLHLFHSMFKVTFSLVPFLTYHYLNMQKASSNKWSFVPCLHLLVIRGSMAIQY